MIWGDRQEGASNVHVPQWKVICPNRIYWEKKFKHKQKHHHKSENGRGRKNRNLESWVEISAIYKSQTVFDCHLKFNIRLLVFFPIPLCSCPRRNDKHLQPPTLSGPFSWLMQQNTCRDQWLSWPSGSAACREAWLQKEEGSGEANSSLLVGRWGWDHTRAMLLFLKPSLVFRSHLAFSRNTVTIFIET